MTLEPTKDGRWRWLSLDALRPTEENPRTITVERFESLKRAIEAEPTMLQARPVVARTDGRIVAGEMRWRAVCDLGGVLLPGKRTRRTEIPGFVVDIDDQRARLWLLRDNQEYGEWDGDLLAELVYHLKEEDADLDLTGIAEQDVEKILASVSGSTPEPPPFPEPDPHVDYKCPNCGHGWSGSPR